MNNATLSRVCNKTSNPSTTPAVNASGIASKIYRAYTSFLQASQPFGLDGLGTWLEYSGESGVN